MYRLVGVLVKNLSFRMLLTATGVASICLAPSFAQESDLSARDMFYSSADMLGNKAAPKPKPASTVHRPAPSGTTAKSGKDASQGSAPTTVQVATNALGLRYAILKRNPDGRYAEVTPDAVFHGGDKIRISVMANEKGYLYIVQQGSSGTWSPLLPDPGINGGANAVEAGHNYVIPNGAGQGFAMDEHAGQERMFLLLTREPEPDLDKLVLRLRNSGGQGTQTATIKNSVIDGLRDSVQSRDLVLSKSDDSEDKAVYVVNKADVSNKPDARVMADVKLEHK